MNMRRKSTNIGAIILPILLSVFSSCQQNNEKVSEHGAHHQHTTELVQAISPTKLVLSRQATVTLQPGSPREKFKAEGYITIATDRNVSVAARFGGRIEKLYFKYNNQLVRQGEKIMDIYSPVLRTIQEEHLFLIKSGANTSLIEKSKERLRLLGITDSQIIQLERNGMVAAAISVFSPANGYVFFNVPASQRSPPAENEMTQSSMSMGRETEKGNTYFPATLQIREGMYVNAGQALFNINDLQEMWALVSLPNERFQQIRKSQEVQLFHESNFSRSLKGKIILSEQTFEEGNQRFARVRIALPNASNNLKVNSLVTAEFLLDDETGGLQVPASAVYRTGLNAYVWVKTSGRSKDANTFRIRKVIAGTSNNGYVVIKGGVSPDDKIALHAGLMIDSETFLNEN